MPWRKGRHDGEVLVYGEKNRFRIYARRCYFIIIMFYVLQNRTNYYYHVIQ